jgi:uncharacterized protein YjiS (DUF1127 family)
MKHRPAPTGISLKQHGPIFSVIETHTAQEAEMLQHLKDAIQRQNERARHRRSYRALLELEDHFLRDIGVTRDEVRGRMASDRLA